MTKIETWEDTGQGYPLRWWVLPIVCLPTLAMLLDGNIVFIALPAIGDTFRYFPNLGEWVLASFSLVAAALSLPAGELGDRIGLRRVFSWGLWLFILGSGICFFAFKGWILILGRVICACGAAILAPVALACLRRIFPPEEQAIAFGYWSASVTIGTVIGPFLGGFLEHIASWHWVFFAPVVPAAIGLLGLPLLPLLPAKQISSKPDYMGITTIGFAIFFFLFFLMESPNLSPSLNILIICLFLLTVVMWRQSANKSSAVIPLNIITRNSWYVPSVLQLFIRALFVFVMTCLTVYFQEGRSLSALDTSIHILPLSIVSGVVSLASGYLEKSFGVKYLMMATLTLTALGFWSLRDIPLSGFDGGDWFGMVAFGILYGNTAQLSHQALVHFPKSQAMRGSAINTLTINLGLALGAAIYSIFISIALPLNLKQQSNWQFPVEIPSSVQEILNQVDQNLHTSTHSQSLQALQESLAHSFGFGFTLCAIFCVIAIVITYSMRPFSSN
ncbi:MFS transporter [Cyanobacterium sp. Dongsha4]|uniref:MFS transporter n=1 Tax=Cyanobacterium sp. DS4 TaxID=2878255 RepID=UPI002E80DB7C|nr:MFS transporter [Cyanobacterium sp. Dongsha4]WVL01071.1 MFS transporter [Cyanobacterium sp. Dongsha4]